jgi:DNA-binding LytR/AlgR family response regulator
MTRALIAEDEPLLAQELQEALQALWPELTIVATASDGHAALRAFEAERPALLFLDVQMPGLTGLQVAELVAGRAHVVFVTAYEHYAVQAFDAGAVDYLLKPLDTARLARALQRVRERMAEPPRDLREVLRALPAASTAASPPPQRLRWVRVQQGRELRLVAVEDICYFRADNKYVAVVTADSEGLISLPLKELLPQLDPEHFWQVHRGTVVNVQAIDRVQRSTMGGSLTLKLKARPETLQVSSSYAHLFRQM